MAKPVHQRFGLTVVLVLASLITVLLLLQPIIKSTYHVSLNYNEGWNAYHAARAVGDEMLYPEPTELYSNNYPPLSFYIIGGLGSLTGDNIFAGRLLNLISFISIGISIAVIVHMLGGGAAVSIFSCLLFLGYMGAYHADYVGVNDPQMLAHAIMMLALIFFVAGTHSRLFLLISLLLVLTAGLVKHTLIALPLAMTLCLFLRDRKQFIFWLTAALLLLISSIALLYQAYGVDFFLAVLASPRSYSAGRAAASLAAWFKPLLPLLGAGLLLVLADRASHATRLIGLYVLLSAITCIYFSGAEGVNYNAIFDLVIAAVIASGLAVRYFARNLQEKWPRSSIETIAVIILFLPVFITAPISISKFKYLINGMEIKQAIVEQDIAFIEKHKGPVLCESLALCYWAGKKLEGDFFNLGQKVMAGIIPENNITARLDNHYFTLIQVERYSSIGTSWRLPKNVNDSMLAHYQISRTSGVDGFFLTPKDTY